LRDPRRRPLLVLITDGRATVAAGKHGDPVADSLRAAGLLAADGGGPASWWTSEPARSGSASATEQLASTLDGAHVTLDELSADRSPVWCSPLAVTVAPAPRKGRKRYAARKTVGRPGRRAEPPSSAANRPLVIVHTGVMKGKSTAAFGLALRGWNQGWDIGVFQFVKSAKWKVGEEAALTALGEVHQQDGHGGPVEWHRWAPAGPGRARRAARTITPRPR